MRNVILGLCAVATICGLVIAGAASQQPDVMHIERSVLIQAAPADVFPYTNDYALRGAWDPWRDLDPHQEIAISETTAGVGAWTSWNGNDDVGQGKMTITESIENERVVADIEFITPWESLAVATLTLTPVDDATEVTWSFESGQAFGEKLFTMFMDMDAMVGPDFERGLAKLKTVSEAAARAREATEREAIERTEAAPPEPATPAE